MYPTYQKSWCNRDDSLVALLLFVGAPFSFWHFQRPRDWPMTFITTKVRQVPRTISPLRHKATLTGAGNCSQVAWSSIPKKIGPLGFEEPEKWGCSKRQEFRDEQKFPLVFFHRLFHHPFRIWPRVVVSFKNPWKQVGFNMVLCPASSCLDFIPPDIKQNNHFGAVTTAVSVCGFSLCVSKKWRKASVGVL